MKKTATLAVGMLVLAAVAGWFVLARDPATVPPDAGARSASSRDHPSPSTPSEEGPTAGASGPSDVGELPVTGEADAYAAAVAGVVFGMDTRTHEPEDYRQALLGQADDRLSVTGYADLERLLAERIPTGEQWARMRANAQWSEFEPAEVWEPGSWAQVVIAGQAEPGWVVRNVTGVQTTHYTQDGAARSAVRERTVTVAMRCPAPDAGVEACRLVLVGAAVLP